MSYPSRVQCFFIEPTERAKVGLRRYHGSEVKCAGRLGYHSALEYIGECDARIAHRKDVDRCVWQFDHDDASIARADPRWPNQCDCGYAFVDSDEWQVWHEPIYRRADTGALTTVRDAGPGAMWDAWWYPWKGPDGRSLIVKLPNGNDWCIDARASNCTMPKDTAHRCWVRHGEPPVITVDKNGLTCAAGAGSIQSGDYHGFLRNGRFEP